MEIGDKLKKMREENGWVQKEVADKAGISRSTLSDAENDKAGNIAISTLERILSAYDMTLQDFFEAKTLPMKNLTPEEHHQLMAVLEVLRSGSKLGTSLLGAVISYREEILSKTRLKRSRAG
jgi:transcriptional regulator with XRE-family HTH domain